MGWVINVIYLFSLRRLTKSELPLPLTIIGPLIYLQSINKTGYLYSIPKKTIYFWLNSLGSYSLDEPKNGLRTRRPKATTQQENTFSLKLTSPFNFTANIHIGNCIIMMNRTRKNILDPWDHCFFIDPCNQSCKIN